MRDIFGNYVQEGDFILYNECQLGKIVSLSRTALAKPQTFYPAAVDFLSMPSLSKAKISYAIVIKTERGKEYLLDTKKRIVLIRGLSESVTDKFK